MSSFGNEFYGAGPGKTACSPNIVNRRQKSCPVNYTHLQRCSPLDSMQFAHCLYPVFHVHRSFHRVRRYVAVVLHRIGIYKHNRQAANNSRDDMGIETTEIWLQPQCMTGAAFTVWVSDGSRLCKLRCR